MTEPNPTNDAIPWHPPCCRGDVLDTAPRPIALVMPGFEPGGTEGQMIELARRLDRTRWNVHVACFHRRGAWFDRIAREAASVTEFPVVSFRTPSAFRHAWHFARWCRDWRIAVVHTTDLYSNIFGLPAAALAGVPVRIANRRELNPDKRPAQIAMQRAAYACANKVVANSRAAAERLRFEHVPWRKIAVVPNGLSIDGAVCPPRRPTALRKIVVVANLRPEKGHDVLIDASVDVLRRFPDARFEIVGDGPERNPVMTAIASHGVAHAFSFLGHREDVVARLAAADIFVLPSRSEAFPNAVLEAMGAGLPIVASAVGGILELIDHGRTGLLTPPGDARALAQALDRLMSDAAFGARLGDAAHTEARTHYSFDRMVAGFESVYLDELGRRGILGAPHPKLAAS
jgi:L-malate glycosyltransferase